MEAISFKDFSMTYGEDGFGLQDINLNIGEGEFVVLTGGTGSGKSTLLRQMKREFVASHYMGSVRVLDKEIRDTDKHDTLAVGYVMQFAREQIVTDKVFHELSFGLENMGLSTDEIRLRVSETAHYFGLSNYMDKCTHELSGGEMQILNLASVMAMRPRILLLDEPTSQLDEVTAEKFLALVYRINRELGTTIVIAEHRLDMLDRYSKVVIMDAGKIVYEGKEPSGYNELPIYMRVGERLGKRINSIVECRDALMDAKNNGQIGEMEIAREEEVKTDTVLKVHDLWYRYRKNDRDVLKGVDLILNRGEILSIIGANGVGKSTLLTLLVGSREAYRGTIKRYGHKVIYIAQNPVFSEDSVEKELLHAIDAYVDVYKYAHKKDKLTEENIEDKKRSLIELKDNYMTLLGLKNVENNHPNEISGGERAKLAIIIGLLSCPDVLLLDEPTKGLDRDSKEVVKDALRELTRLQKSVILVSHDIELVGEISTRVATLFDGKILSICMPRLLLKSNYLYTTTSSRIARGIIDDVVLERELLGVIESGQKVR